MFVPGNSGGPIFDGETGRVIAFVHGFISPEIVQNYENTNAKNIADGAPNKHIQSLHAIYSIGIKLDSVRTELERFGVVLP
jgi:starvation-inducible outer membrane lipoprotein